MSPTLHRAARWVIVPALALPLAAHAQCPAQPSELVERFIDADCAACWREASAPAAAAFVLDWIVPSERGDEAALSVAALAEGARRAGTPPPEPSSQRRHALAARPEWRVSVKDGPAWSGYMAVQLHAQRDGAAPPAVATGYLALVETVRAGSEGSPLERRLVRALAGPLALDGASGRIEHLVALRIPPGARTERLAAVGWVEGPAGNVIALAQAAAAGCATAK